MSAPVTATQAKCGGNRVAAKLTMRYQIGMGLDLKSRDFLWDVEEACSNAFPAAREIILEGWLLRAAGGRTRRTNSVNPLRFGPRDPTGIVPEAEAIYASLDRPALFRVPSLVPDMDIALRRLGYEAQGEVCTLFADLTGFVPGEGADFALASTPHTGWYEAWAELGENPSPAIVADYRRSVDTLLLPKAFACRHVDGTPVAVAYAALFRGLVVLESVLTHPLHRQQGHGGAIVRRLMAWAKEKGAQGVCLQVTADNGPARQLYARAGFTTELYRYHYLRAGTTSHQS
ncbi:GNAT family N-acetyltransferase [Lichenifustis flavocetrariae]|uniref:GNAT family N-acetyltransferase n=1 Tax=Lichenifustis flavocetrariae TaxID=2949735 RepID=A0AA41YV49_9HYPH|nr:GNAT family N-acetyltransferase [Lichenifustis flavocetrariae]MCW6509149.1 GNAT family N-acetyltransferase [Lichenifustis flavocetrariae]